MVQTRNQVKNNPLATPPTSLSKLPKRKQQLTSSQEDAEPLSPLSPNTVDGAAQQLDGFNLKSTSAQVKPASYPVSEATSSDTDDEGGSKFKISARPAMDVDGTNSQAQILIERIASHTTKNDSCDSLVLREASDTAIAAVATKLFGERKLLKPLPEKPVECTKLPDGPEPVAIEIEYPSREELQPLENPEAAIEEMLVNLDSSSWQDACKALHTLRQLVTHSPSVCTTAVLEKAIPLLTKSVRSLRSTVSKTAIMAAADVFLSFGDSILPLCDIGGTAKPLNSLLSQLLLKAASNDKKFVIEEAVRALTTLAGTTSPESLIVMLTPYVDHKNLRVRGKTSIILDEVVERMAPMQAADFGLPALLSFSGKLITDNTPDARHSAHKMVVFISAVFNNEEVQTKYACTIVPPEPEATVNEDGEVVPPPGPWQRFVHKHLNPSAATAVLRVV